MTNSRHRKVLRQGFFVSIRSHPLRGENVPRRDVWHGSISPPLKEGGGTCPEGRLNKREPEKGRAGRGGTSAEREVRGLTVCSE